MLVRRAAAATGLLLLALGAALLLWPVEAPGVSGTALRPVYGEVGVTAVGRLPETVTVADLRAAGARVPADPVPARRAVAGAAGLTGVAMLGAAATVLRRP